jgi:hypothetical protein
VAEIIPGADKNKAGSAAEKGASAEFVLGFKVSALYFLQKLLYLALDFLQKHLVLGLEKWQMVI